MTEKVLDVHEKPRRKTVVNLSLQHMFAMFGATILVPQIVGSKPSNRLLTSGIATIVFILVTRFQVPAYLRFIICLYHTNSYCNRNRWNRKCDDRQYVRRTCIWNRFATYLENGLSVGL